MAAAKYGDLIIGDIIQKSLHPEITAPKLSYRGEIDSGGTNFSFDWSCLSRTIDMRQDSHAHDFDEFLIFTGTNPHDMSEFRAEVELCLGEECEKFTITEPTVFYIPKGLMHCPLDFKKIEKPIAYWNIFFSPDYSLNVTTTPQHPGIKAAKSRYQKYVIKPSIRTITLEANKAVTDITYLDEGAGGGLSVHWYVITEPLVIFEPPHSHDHDQFMVFMGGNAMDIREFDAEIDIWLGKEAEKHTIDGTSLVHIPRGLVHGKTDFRRVGKPVMLMRLSISPE